MVKKIKGIIQEVSVFKTGTHEGREWTMFSVKINDIQFKTFDKKYEKAIGQEVEAEYKEEQKEVNGKVYINRTLLKFPEVNVNDLFLIVDQKLDMIIAMIKGVGAVKEFPGNDEIPIVENDELPPPEAYEN